MTFVVTVSLWSYSLAPPDLSESPSRPHIFDDGALSSLGLEADRSYKLGSIDSISYKAELDKFITSAFPKSMQSHLHASLDLFVPDEPLNGPVTYPPVPKKIWQTHKDKSLVADEMWMVQPGYEYTHLDNEEADAWVEKWFKGSEIATVWNKLDIGILKSDFFRYLVLLIEGGIYSDMDTILLRPIPYWGNNPDLVKGTTKPTGPPSLFVGVEADVGERADWHSWWSRPLQIVQWTIASAPHHPVLLDAVRRVHNTTMVMDNWRHSHGSKGTEADGDAIRVLLGEKGSWMSVMEWTGPGIFTDSVFRYLAVQHGMMWPAAKNLRRPLRAQDIVVLPVTAFSPGVGIFGSEEPEDEQALVHHLFAGTWKEPVEEGS